jgi:hypothetical protein
MFAKELYKFAPGVFRRQAIVGRTIVAEKAVVGFRINL